MLAKYTIAIFVMILVSLAMASPVSTHSQTAYTFNSKELRIRLTPRTPQQMAAFYEARGFDKAMIDKIKQFCFFTVYIKNKSKHIIWHDLSLWTFSHHNKIIQRIDRQQLQKLWQKMGISLAHQSTFRWTLLPERLDFRPKEREGGNIVIPATHKPFNIEARFNSQADKTAKKILVKLDNIQCKKDPS